MNTRQVTRQTAPAAQTATTATPAPHQRGKLVATFAARLGVDADQLLKTLKDTAFKQPKGQGGAPPAEITNEQMMALLVVANEYELNPFTKEIYAFPAKGGGIVPIISIDGWIRIINARTELASIEFEYADEGSDNPWVSCTITRKDRDRPVTIREYLSECRRDTDPWNQMPHRMLRHKALIQCARVAFGYGGIYDPDEAERVANAMAIDSTATEVTRGKPLTAEPRAKQIEAPKAPEIPLRTQVAQLIDAVGVPESQVLARFEAGSLDDLTEAQHQEALEWMHSLQY